MIHEEDWHRHLAIAVFRYNCSRHSATGIISFRALFGVDAFDSDTCLGLQLRLEDEPENVGRRWAEVHGLLYKSAMKSRYKAQPGNLRCSTTKRSRSAHMRCATGC